MSSLRSLVLTGMIGDWTDNLTRRTGVPPGSIFVTMTSTLLPPSYPLRPVNGGPLPLAQPKHGYWVYEPKLNGWRAWVHPATRRMFNRENEPLSITGNFAPVLDRLQAHAPHLPDWIDVEALSRRVPVGKGSLIILDTPLPQNYDSRQQLLYNVFIGKRGIAIPWAHEQLPPPENELLLFGYTYADAALQADQIRRGLFDTPRDAGQAIDPDLFPTAAWSRLQAVNKALGCELFEGLVAKRMDSLYPLQLRSPTIEFPFWMKHRWAF